MAKSMNRRNTIANEYVERCSTSVAVTEKQIKTTVIKTLGLQKLDVR